MAQYPGRPKHLIPHWIDSGARFHIRIRAEADQNIAFDSVAAELLSAAEFYVQSGRWWYSVFMIMPDHVHAIVTFPPNAAMAEIVGHWKRYTARCAGVRWQPNFFDHRFRSPAEADEAWHYIQHNPVRAKLCAQTDDWPWWSATSGRAGPSPRSGPNAVGASAPGGRAPP